MSSSPRRTPSASDPQVPREPPLDGEPGHHAPPTPSAADVNTPDEQYYDGDKPLVAGSDEARALHDRPPPAKGELGVGTAGDAARPSKLGLHDKGVAPRNR